MRRVGRIVQGNRVERVHRKACTECVTVRFLAATDLSKLVAEVVLRPHRGRGGETLASCPTFTPRFCFVGDTNAGICPRYGPEAATTKTKARPLWTQA